MQLIIDLPDRAEVLASNRHRWAEVLADPMWHDHPYRIETNVFGQIIMTPPAAIAHSSRQFRIARELEDQLGGRALTECAISTIDGVKAADVAWYTDERYEQVRGQVAAEIAPEICVEILSPRNTTAEMETKRQLYFDAGAKECWTCDQQGNMSYHHSDAPKTKQPHSKLCPNFPSNIQD